MTPPVVLFALQSPTLLRRLAKSKRWRLRVLPLGDHEGLSEASQLGDVQPLAPEDGVPYAIVVCSPRQLAAAQELTLQWGRKVPIAWACHNGYEPGLSCGWKGPLLTFSANNLATHATGPREHTYVIRPHFARDPVHGPWPEGMGDKPSFFLMRNRPQTRALARASRETLEEDVVERSRIRLAVFGQDQDRGILTPEERDEWFAHATGYLSVLPTNAGFALAEHEALERGCPLFGLRWGDAHVTLAGYPGLRSCADELVGYLEMARRAMDEGPAARRARWSEIGYDLLATHYGARTQDQGVSAFVDGIAYAST